MSLTMCAQPELVGPGVGEALCVDAIRLSQISGKPIVASQKGMRPSAAVSEPRTSANTTAA